MMFAVGMLLLATAALLAPYLQTLAGYSVSKAGLLMAPRGVGTMVGDAARRPPVATASIRGC